MKALEALDRVRENSYYGVREGKIPLSNYCDYYGTDGPLINDTCEFELAMDADYEIIENALKALDVIKTHNLLLNNKNLDKLNEEEKNILIGNGVLK